MCFYDVWTSITQNMTLVFSAFFVPSCFRSSLNKLFFGGNVVVLIWDSCSLYVLLDIDFAVMFGCDISRCCIFLCD